jgi:hypothetical protein
MVILYLKALGWDRSLTGFSTPGSKVVGFLIKLLLSVQRVAICYLIQSRKSTVYLRGQ